MDSVASHLQPSYLFVTEQSLYKITIYASRVSTIFEVIATVVSSDDPEAHGVELITSNWGQTSLEFTYTTSYISLKRSVIPTTCFGCRCYRQSSTLISDVIIDIRTEMTVCFRLFSVNRIFRDVSLLMSREYDFPSANQFPLQMVIQILHRGVAGILFPSASASSSSFFAVRESILDASRFICRTLGFS